MPRKGTSGPGSAILLGRACYGGDWIYGQRDDQLSIGFVVGLDHSDARLRPHALRT